MTSNLIARLENTNLPAGSTTTLVFDWPGGEGQFIAEGLVLIGTAVIQPLSFYDTFGEQLSLPAPWAIPNISGDGSYLFVLPPGRLKMMFDPTGSGSMSFQRFSVYLAK